jgi:hypothetical protein
MSEDRHALLVTAAAPRRASAADAPSLSRLFAAAFTADPVFNWNNSSSGFSRRARFRSAKSG